MVSLPAGKADVPLEKPCGVVNHLQNFGTEVPQQQKSWNPFRDVRLVDRYIEGKAHILVFFRCGETSEHLACFGCPDRWSGCGKHHLLKEEGSWTDDSVSSVESSFLAWKHSTCDWNSNYGQQNPVLVDYVQIVQLPSPMPKTSLVWLDAVENMKGLIPDAWYFSARHVTKRFGGIKDWETGLRVGLISAGLNERTSQMVERAAEIMQSIPKLKGQTVIDDRYRLDVIDKLSRLRIVLTPDGVGVLQPEGIDGSLEIIDLLFGPVVFC
jgi:hypothetical protein